MSRSTVSSLIFLASFVLFISSVTGADVLRVYHMGLHGSQHQLWEITSYDGALWNSDTHINSDLNSAPTSLYYNDTDTLYVIYAAGGNSLGYISRTSSTSFTVPTTPFTPVNKIHSGPYAVRYNNTSFVFFYSGMANEVGYIIFDPSAPGGYTSDGNVPFSSNVDYSVHQCTGPVAAVYGGLLYVFWVDGSSSAKYNVYNGTHWLAVGTAFVGPTYLTYSVQGLATASYSYQGTNVLYLFYSFPDYGVWTTRSYYTGAGWTSPIAVANNVAAYDNMVSVIYPSSAELVWFHQGVQQSGINSGDANNHLYYFAVNTNGGTTADVHVANVDTSYYPWPIWTPW